MKRDRRPYKNEHAARIKEPDQYDSFSRQNDEFGEGIHVIYGIKEEEDTTEVQSIRFDKEEFTVEEAKEWLDENDWDYIKFEPAIEEESVQTFEEEYDQKGFFKRFIIGDNHAR